jgi:hypothetical protein
MEAQETNSSRTMSEQIFHLAGLLRVGGSAHCDSQPARQREHLIAGADLKN